MKNKQGAQTTEEETLIINGIPTPFKHIDKRSKAWREHIGRTGAKNPKGYKGRKSRSKSLRPHMPVVSIEQISEAIQEHHGILTDVAKACDLTNTQLRVRLLENPKLQAQLDEAKEDFVGIAEHYLLNAIKQGDIRAIMYALKCQGRRQGWNPDQAISVKTDLSADEAKAAVATLFGIDKQDESDSTDEVE